MLRSRRVLLLDDRPCPRISTRALLAGEQWVSEIVEAATVDDMVCALVTRRVDLAALNMTGCPPVRLHEVRQMTRRNSDTVIVVLPGPDEPYFAAAAVRAGVRGYLLDTAGPQVVRAAVRTVAAGGLVFGPGIGPRVLHLLDEQTSADMRSVHSGPSMMGSPPLRSCLAP